MIKNGSPLVRLLVCASPGGDGCGDDPDSDIAVICRLSGKITDAYSKLLDHQAPKLLPPSRDGDMFSFYLHFSGPGLIRLVGEPVVRSGSETLLAQASSKIRNLSDKGNVLDWQR